MAAKSRVPKLAIAPSVLKGLAFWAGALVCWLAAAALAAALLGFSVADPFPPPDDPYQAVHFLGQGGALAAGLGYRVLGLAAWGGPVLLLLAGCFLVGRRLDSLVPLTAAGLWALVSGSALLGAAGATASLGGAFLPAGGRGGAAMAAGLAAWLGAGPAWWLCLAGLTAGTGIILWRLWPMAYPWLRPHAVPPRPAAPEPLDRPAPRDKPEPAAATAPRPESTPAPALSIKPRETLAMPAAAGQGPRAAGRWSLPPLELLAEGRGGQTTQEVETIHRVAAELKENLAHYGVEGDVADVSPGPVVTMYEFKPAPGVKISKVAGLADDLAMNLKALSIRIVAPIPGKAAIGIEVPNARRETVYLREVLASAPYAGAKGPLAVALGRDILGRPEVGELSRMPHLLIAGATGAGKSVFINSLVLSLLYRTTPDSVRLLMVDPKRIELSTYNDVPHLLYPVITSPKEATAGLRWAVGEMERRYELLAEAGVRGVASYNQKAAAGELPPDPDGRPAERLPYLVIIIDELADLMMVSSKEVESLITRLAQMARAAGIHLVVATQRPSVDVITGLIKANFPARISFQVASRVDSRTILDQQGAEHLLGMGDMLFVPPGTAGLQRIHGAFVSDAEIERVVEFWRAQAPPEYDQSVVAETGDNGEAAGGEEEADERYLDAVAIVKESGQASISYVQRRLRVGYNRAARMIEQMEREGIVGPSDGSKPREVLVRD